MIVKTESLQAIPARARISPSTRTAFILITSLFFMWGLSHGLLDVLNKHFQDTLHVSRAQSGLVQTAYFGAYFFIALPVGRFMERFGYKAGILVGLALFAAGALLFVPASIIGSFSPFLIALFILACGLACLETAANLYAAALGAPEKAEQRLTLAQSFNGLGAFLGPIIGGAVFFAPPVDVGGVHIEAASLTYVILAAGVVVMMMVFIRTPLPEMRNEHRGTGTTHIGQGSIWKRKNFTGACVAQFCNVGSYVGIGAFFINYALDHWDGLTAQRAAFLLSLGMLAYMVGRFAGTWLMRYIEPRKLLTTASIINVFLCGIAMAGIPVISIFGVIALYLFMSIMYPTIFAMGVRGMGSQTKEAGSFLVMTLVGGAILPLVMGALADVISISFAFIIPLLSFVVIGWYAISQRGAAQQA
ncbi:sugar MFS transporter (plasmid) [Pseudomonas luteola]|uniref:sugar MFS transporter n=1 Tax=Pseudomonas luteola TaxID=47886 RepID=UPI00388D5BF0